MSDYSIAYSGFASMSTRVTADTPQAAIDKAEPYVRLCQPTKVIDLDTGDVVWTAPDEQEQAIDYLVEQVRELHKPIVNSLGVRSCMHCAYELSHDDWTASTHREPWPCATARLVYPSEELCHDRTSHQSRGHRR